MNQKLTDEQRKRLAGWLEDNIDPDDLATRKPSVSEKVPDLFHCVDPAIAELVEARNHLLLQIERLEQKLTELLASRTQKQAVSLSLAAEDVAKTSHQIQQLAEGVHRGIAKRLNLENRI